MRAAAAACNEAPHTDVPHPRSRSEPMPTLVLLRHGQSQWNLEDRFTGWVDVDLSAHGEAEARRGGELIAKAGLELDRCFAWDDDDDEMLHFLEQAGFVHVAGAFTEGEMAALSRDMDVAAPSYTPGDGRSWWARTADGAQWSLRWEPCPRGKGTG